MSQFKATTIVAVHTKDGVALAGDGQVTMGEHTIMKHTATKVRRLHHGRVLTGFAGSVADAFVLYDRFEKALDEAHGNLEKASIALAQGWRTDQALRKLDALLLAADQEKIFLISGGGEVIAAEEGVAAIGSGGNFALAAAKALKDHTDMKACEIAEKALRIAAEICVYTNDHITVLTLGGDSDDRAL